MGSQITVAIERSIVRNRSDGNSVFAINFAGGASIVLDFKSKRIEGILGASILDVIGSRAIAPGSERWLAG